MAESEEDLRKYLREKVAEEKKAIWWSRWFGGERNFLPWLRSYDGELDPRMHTRDPVYDLESGEGALTDLEAASAEKDPTAMAQSAGKSTAWVADPTADPFNKAIPPPAEPPDPSPRSAAAVAAPAPAQGVPSASQIILRAVALFGAIVALGVGAVIAQRSPENLVVWLIVAVALVVCAILFLAAGRSSTTERQVGGGPPIVS